MSERDVKEKLDRLKAIRAANRGVITKKVNDVNEILHGTEAEGTLNEEQAKRLDVINRLLEGKLKTLVDIDEKILSLCDLDVIPNEIEESERVVEKIVESQKYIHDAIQKRNSETHTQESQANSVGLNQAMQSTFHPIQVKAKLPKLTLPKFRGEVTKWTSFWDSFKSAIHENNGISKVDKFNYLNSLLEASASRSIQGLSLTDSNYDSAIEILQERFGKPQQIISAHMDELLKLPSCTGTDSSSSLRLVYDKLSVHVRGLTALGVASDQYGGLLIPVIMAKLPNEIRLRVARETKRSVWKIEELLDLIKQEVEARELSEGVKASEERNSKPNNFMSKSQSKYPTANSLVSNENQSKRGMNIQCAYCKDFHYSASCEKVTKPSERKGILIKSSRCFKCLKTGHQVKECKYPKNCRNCGGRHHQSICLRFKESKDPEEKILVTNTTEDKEKSTSVTTTGSAVTTTASAIKTKGNILLQTAIAVATNDENTKSMKVRILFDNGSQRSYITDSLKSKLGLKTTSSETLHLNTFGEKVYRKQKCQVVNLPLRTENECIKISALCFPAICSPLPQSIDVKEYPHLQDLQFADSFEDQHSIDILIGSDYYWDIVTGQTIRGESGPTAVNSKFGWILSGPTNNSSSETKVVSNLVISGETAPFNATRENDEIVDMLKKFWDVESVGREDRPKTQDNLTMETKQHEEISFNGSFYEVGLPWKENCSPTSNNYRMCESRLRSLHHKLKEEPELLQEYDKIIQEQLLNNIVERVQKSSCLNEQTEKDVHYSPHHAVVRKERDTTKVRIVYDGSAKSSKGDLSLNDCLETGTNHIPLIFEMLSNFRWNSVAITADIEKAFLMVGIKEEHRDMLRFLWFKDLTTISPEIVQLRFNRLVFGLRPSPSILGETIKHHQRLYKQSEPEMTELLEKSLYVDDLVTGADSVENAFQIYKKSKKMLGEGGFNLRKWSSNSRRLLEEIKNTETAPESPSVSRVKPLQETATEDVESYAKSTMGLGNSCPKEEHFVKILGLNWNTHSDQFFFNFTKLFEYATKLPMTKRSILKVTAKIFDPLGFLTPFSVVMKILFQELCVNKLEWDDELQGDVLRRWNLILQSLKCLEANQIPRCYFEANPVHIQLHGFSDASEHAYAAVVYLRSCYQDGHIDARLVASKSRVSPLVKQSIPRLELLGALLLAQLLDKFNSSKQNLETICWTDSMTTLCWIRNERMWKQYVQHRVDEIRNITSKDAWRHCPGSLNAADLPSRGSSGKELTNNKSWWNGPEFLYSLESEWPENRPTQSLNEATFQEAVKNPPSIIHSLANTSTHDGVEKKIDRLIDVKRIGNLTKLLRVTALVVKFVNKLKNQTRNARKAEKEEYKPNELDLDEAEDLWIRSVQASSFIEELKFLRNSNSKVTPPIHVKQFGLFLDKGIIKCKGRMNNSSLPLNSRNPVLLPAKHTFVQFIIKDAHYSVKHCGVRDTLTTLRERYWILRGREAVKKFIRKCVICRKYEGKPYKSLPTADLPSERVSEDPPFTHIGLDFAGPLFITEENSSKKTEISKVYICLFTCASTRAVHLELTRSLSAQAFLLAFRRFSARRGLPATITSDNAKSFKSSCKDVRKITRSEEVCQFLTHKRITWNFIIEKAPWWGGYWERLVQSIKRPLKKVLGRSTLNFDELNTLLVEIEGVINSRPLTYIYDDVDSLSYPLTPSDLIYGRRITPTANSSHHEIISSYQSLTRRLRHHKNLLQQVTKQWRREYLTGLRERKQPGTKESTEEMISVGDIVILKNDSTCRSYWKLAKVEELIKGSDGMSRAAIIKVANSNKRPVYLRRVIQHLIPLEVRSNTCAERSDSKPDEQEARVADIVKPRRNAALIGEINRRDKNIV